MELHVIFFILAGVLIAILIGFSLWTARREKSDIFSNTFSTRPVVTPAHHNESLANEPVDTQAYNEEYETISAPEENLQQMQQEVESSLQNIKISLPNEPSASEQSSSQSHTYGQRIAAQQHIQNTPNFENRPVEVVEPEIEPNVQPIVESVVEPAVKPIIEPIVEPINEPDEPQFEQEEQEENPFVTLYIYAPQDQPFRGDTVVHFLEEVGLRFGEHDIFHRHQYIDDLSSPIIFSAANLINPGTFDLHNINNFTTAGLVLFMQLPTGGNDIVNMKQLISNAEHLTHSLGGFLYDDTQQPFEEQSRQRYMQRVMQ